MTTLATPVLAFTLVFAGLLGLVIGSFLNVVIYRVPEKISLLRESRCPTCDTKVRGWQNVPVLSWLVLRGRCAACGTRISGRYPLVELVTGLAFVGVVWFFLATSTGEGAVTGWWPAGTVTEERAEWEFWAALAVVIVAYLYFAAVGIALTAIDLDVRRLPNAIVLPGYLVLGALFALACALGADWHALLRAAIGGAALWTFYLILRLARPDGMGAGDVKFSGVVGLALGWLGWEQLIVGAFAAFLVGGIFGLALIGLRRAGGKTAIPFGPWMIVGAWIGIIAGGHLARSYIGLFAHA